MARFSIISKDGAKVRFEGKPRYIGSYLKPSYLEFSEIASPTPIEWEVGDYVDYPRTGMRYRLYSIPQPSKNARKGAVGNSFTYSNVQFFSATKELEIALFRDLVDNDNNIHFSTSPDVATFENVEGIIRRIQACMNDLYPDRWEIRLASFDAEKDADTIERIAMPKDFALSGGTCLDALSKIYDLWEGIGWFHSYENGKEIITVGYANTRNAGNTTESYLYGKGNGLTAIRKHQTNKEEFATRLYVYGSERNLPARYYNDKDILNAESVDIRNLMLPLENWGTTEGLPDARKAYLENAEAVAKFGIIPKVHYFDSVDAGADIYPSIEGMTIGRLRKALEAMGDMEYYPSSSLYPDASKRVDEVRNCTNPADDGVVEPEDLGREEKNFSSLWGRTTKKSTNVVSDTTQIASFDFTIAEARACEVVVTPNVNGYIEDNGFDSVSVSLRFRDQNGTAPYNPKVVIAATKEDGRWVFDLPEIKYDYAKSPRTGFPVYIDFIIEATGESVDHARYFLEAGTITYTLKPIQDKTFVIQLDEIGFNIDEMALKGRGKTISMKTGSCAGRNFVIENTRRKGGYWTLICKRQQDNTLGLLFPNNAYQIEAGDRFVLLDIAMPETYVYAASDRLLSEGERLLAKASRIQNHYEPSIDAKVMVESGRTLREGMFMQIEDEDVVDNTTDCIIIDTLSIYEDESAIPTYKVTLRERRKVTYKGTPSATSATDTQSVEDTKAEASSSSSFESFWEVDDNGNVFTTRQIRIKNNLIVDGDTASGGTGGGSVVGATSVVVDGVSYPAKDGVIDMSEAFEGLQPEIDLSDYYTKGEVNELIDGVTSGDIDLANYYTKSQIDDKFEAIDFSPYATKESVNGVSARVSALEGTGYATKEYVDSSISSLVNGAPTTLDTLKEIADAFEESQDVIDALDKAIGTKASQTALDATTERVGSLESTLKTEQGNIDTLEGYFSSGIAKKATADAKGNVIDTYYTPIATYNAFKESTNASLALKATASDLSALAGRVTANEGSISSLQSGKADKATTLAGYGIGDAYTKTDIDAKVLTINNALALRYTKNEVDAIVETINDALDNRYTKAQTNSAISTALASYYTKNEIDGKVTTINDALADRYTKAQVDGIVTTINQSISSVDNKYAPTKTWADTLASLIVNENGNIRIKTNLIVNGDTASGGGSGSASVGISGIKLNGTTYRDENSDGIIDLGTITSGLTSVSWSDVKDRPTALSQFDNDLNLGSLAYKNGLTASDVGALSTSGGTISTNLTIQSGNDGKLILDNTDQDNKWNLIYFKQNGVEYGRLGTADSDNITWNGKHIYHSGNFTSSVITTALGYTPLSTAGGTISGSIDFVSGNAIKSNSQNVLVMYAGIDTYLYGSNNIYLSTPNLYHYTDSGVYKVLDSGNYSSYALPLSGGTISGASGALTIARTDADQIGILFKGKSGDLGFLGFGSSGTPAYINVSGTPYTLLHSGNYSDYALPLSGGLMVGAATIQWGNNQCGWDDVANGLIGMSILKDDPNYGYYAGLSFKGYYGFQIRNLAGGDTYQVRGHNSSQWGTWRTLIHSGNIGDYALKTDGSSKMQGSLNMGTSVIAWGVNNGLQYLGPNADGASLAFFGNGFSDWKTIAFTDSTVDKAKQLVHTNGSYIIYNSGSTFYVGDTIYPDVPTHILGKEVLLRYGASAAIGFILNSSGNVTIGAGDLAGSGGTKLFVDGNIFTSGGSIYRIEDSNIAYYGPAQNGIGANYDGALMYAYDSRPLYFYTGGIRMLINSSGNVLIGTTTDDGTNKLQVNGGISLMGRISSAVSLVFNGDYGIWKGNRFTGALTENDIAYNAAKHIFYNGNVGIGTTSPAHKLDVDGTGNFSVGVKANEVLLGSAGLYKGSYWSSSLSDNDMVISGGKISLSGAVTMSSTLSVSGTSTFNGDVRINGNLVVTGDTASGGSAGATSGGVSILTINGNIPVGSSISQSQLDAIGFTSEILADLMNGKYVYVKNIRSNGSFSLMTISANGGAIYMKEGSENYEMIEYVFYKSSSTTWRIEVYEV